jgi:hypothetical protein
MRVDPQITRYKSREDYLAKKTASGPDLKTVDDAGSLKKDGQSIKTNISKEAKEKAAESASKSTSTATSTASSAGSTTSKLASKIKDIPLPKSSIGGGENVKAADDTKEEDKKNKVDGTISRKLLPPEPFPDKLPEIINTPAIFFITDMNMNPFHSSEGGLKKMAENIPTAKVYSWGDRDEIVDRIKKHNTNQPVILVGHGMGGDTAVEVANELNQIEYGFRKVDLMVTLDSIGMNNDIIPQNVTSNLNIISDGDWLFNDGPNIARKTDRTEVINELRSEPHNELDDHPDIQFQVFEKINTVLGEAVAGRNIERNRIKQLFREQGIQGVHR